MQEVGLPAEVVDAGRDLGGREAQPREADVVVAPVEAGRVAVWRTFTVVELGAEDDVDDEPVRGLHAADLATGHAPHARQPRHHGHRLLLVEDLTIAGDEDARVIFLAQCSRKRSRDLAQTPSLHIIGYFGGHIENTLKGRVVAF
jgi:hypothetical protein